MVVKNFQPLKDRADKGALYENFVASELLKSGIELRYWRSKSKAEVDFVIEKSGKLYPVEIKSGLFKANMTKSFQSFLEHYKLKKGIVFSEKLVDEKGKIKFRPIFSASKELWL